MPDLHIVDTEAIEWENGLDSIAKMAPEFRANLGPAEKQEETFAKYNMKLMFSDPATTKRSERIHLTPGYADLTPSYHDSVEECLILEGACFIHGEGDFKKGDYFWRPPGWVHWVETPEGLDGLLFHAGVSETERSGPSSRRVRPDEECGTNQLHPDHDTAIGPRGWVKRLDTNLVPWQRGPVFARSEGPLQGYDLEHVSLKVLSKNPVAGSQSLLVRLDRGYRQEGPCSHSAAQQLFVLSGSLALGNRTIPKGGYIHREAGSAHPPMASKEGAKLFMKTEGWLDFHRA